MAKLVLQVRSAPTVLARPRVPPAHPLYVVEAVLTPQPTASTVAHAAKLVRAVSSVETVNVFVHLEQHPVVALARTSKPIAPTVELAVRSAALDNFVSKVAVPLVAPPQHPPIAVVPAPTPTQTMGTVDVVASYAVVVPNASAVAVVAHPAPPTVVEPASNCKPIVPTVELAAKAVPPDNCVSREAVLSPAPPIKATALVAVSISKQTAPTVALAAKPVRQALSVSMEVVLSPAPLDKPTAPAHAPTASPIQPTVAPVANAVAQVSLVSMESAKSHAPLRHPHSAVPPVSIQETIAKTAVDAVLSAVVVNHVSADLASVPVAKPVALEPAAPSPVT